MRVIVSGWSCLCLAACSAAPRAVPGAPPTATASSTASVASTPQLPVEPSKSAAPPSPFHVIGELPEATLTLQGVGDRGFLVSQLGIELQLIGDEVVQDPLLKRGLPGVEDMHSVNGVAGRWPDAAWLSASHAYERTGYSTLWTWDGKNWKKKLSTKPGYFIESVQPWVGGRLLALEQAGMWFDASFRVLSGDARAAVPQFDQSPQRADFTFCASRLRVAYVATLPDGAVFAAGQRCEPESGYLDAAVQRWPAGQTRGTMEILPGTSPPADPDNTYWSITGLAALSATNVFVSALETIGSGPGVERRDTGYFAHYDGKSWRQLALPVPGGLRALWSHSSGALYGTDATDQLWSASKAEPGAPWTRVPFPAQIVHDSSESARLLQLWLRAPGDVWAHVQVGVEGKGARSYLLHTRPAVNALPTFEAFKRTDAELALPGPPVDWCPTPFVLLYTLGRNAPANYDYPSTRAALKGHREFENEAAFIEFLREGRRYFGARVSDFKLGKRLATLVKDKVPGATPQLVCHEPAPLRTLDIDLVTGELKPASAP